jgi:hypothetical protein
LSSQGLRGSFLSEVKYSFAFSPDLSQSLRATVIQVNTLSFTGVSQNFTNFPPFSAISGVSRDMVQIINYK